MSGMVDFGFVFLGNMVESSNVHVSFMYKMVVFFPFLLLFFGKTMWIFPVFFPMSMFFDKQFAFLSFQSFFS